MAEEEGEEEGKEEGEEEGKEEGEEEAPAAAPPLAPPAGWVKVFHERRQRHVYVNEETGEMARYIIIIYYIRHVYIHEETGEMASARARAAERRGVCRRARRCRGGPPRRPSREVQGQIWEIPGDTRYGQICGQIRGQMRGDAERYGERLRGGLLEHLECS